jgi:HSP20 family protein
MSRRDYDPWGGMLSWREAMNRLLEDSFVAGVGALQMPLDMYETRDAVVVRASLAGVRPEDIDVTVTGDTLTIRGELPEQAPAGVVRYHHREHRPGALARSVALPLEVQSSRVEATFEHGVLTLTLPKAERLRPRAITINVGGGAQPVRAQARSSGAASEGEHAEPAPATDEAGAESGRTRQATDGAPQTGGAAGPSDETAGATGSPDEAGGAAGPSDETAGLSGDTSDTGRRKQSRTSGAR